MIKLSSLLKFSGIYKYYKSKDSTVYALNNVSFSVDNGEFVALLGNSGAGKSTLMNMIGCLDKPDKGEIFYKDKNIFRFNEKQAAYYRNTVIGFIFQSFYLDPTLTALENVKLPLLYSRVSQKEQTEKAIAALDMVMLSDRISHKPSQLSGGQKQRVAIARAIVNDPEIILADEPTGNLDGISATAIMELLIKINKCGKTVIMVTHNREQIKYCSRVIELKDGEIIKDYKTN